MDQRGKLEQTLLLLGSTADDIAATLRAQNVRGVRNTVRHLNPIVRFVQQHLRIDDYGLDLLHGDGMSSYTLRMTLPSGAKEEAVLPEPVKAFLDAFNSGGYPGLEL